MNSWLLLGELCWWYWMFRLAGSWSAHRRHCRRRQPLWAHLRRFFGQRLLEIDVQPSDALNSLLLRDIYGSNHIMIFDSMKFERRFFFSKIMGFLAIHKAVEIYYNISARYTPGLSSKILLWFSDFSSSHYLEVHRRVIISSLYDCEMIIKLYAVKLQRTPINFTTNNANVVCKTGRRLPAELK